MTVTRREAASFLNQTAPEGAQILVWGADHLVKAYARPDLEITDYRKARNQGRSGFNYAVISTRHNKDQTLFAGAPVLLSIGREGGVFAVVKRLDPGDKPQP